LPLALLEQPFFHDLVLCSFHSPFTSACWASHLASCLDRGGRRHKVGPWLTLMTMTPLWLLHWRPVCSWHSWLTGTVTAATGRTWWITGPFLARRAAHPNPNHQGREFIANGALENGAFCTVFSENFHKF
jgi:hypothetical protein